MRSAKSGTVPAGGRRQRPRRDDEPPAAVAHWGWRYHHLGIPTSTPRRNERHLPHLKIHVSGFRKSPYGIEWMRFERGCLVSELVRRVPHIAFEVDNLDAAVEGMSLLGEITSPSPGVRVAMIEDNGAPVELIEFARSPGRRMPKQNRRSSGTTTSARRSRAGRKRRAHRR